MFYVNLNGKPSSATDTSCLQIMNPTTIKNLAFVNADKYAALYHSCRCAMIKVKFVPRPSMTVLSSKFPLWVYSDLQDGIEIIPSAATPSVELIQGMDRWKLVDITKPRTFIFKGKKQPLNPRTQTFVTPTPVNQQNIPGLWHGCGDSIGTFDAVNGAHGAGYTYGSDANTTLGTLYFTGYFMYKDIQ